MRKTLFLAWALLLLTVLSVSAQSGGTYYVKGRTANARSCASTGCRLIAGLRPGTSVTVIEAVKGQSFAGSTTWFRVKVKDQEGYIHSSLLSTTDPKVGSQYVTFTPTPRVTPISLTPGAPSLQSFPTEDAWTCNCSLQCSAIPTCDQAYFQLMTCGCAGLDADSDGVPCEENLCM